MKKQTLLILFVVLTTSIVVNAQTIALHSSTGVQLFKGNTALVTAYTAAQSGDTLYLSGGTFFPPTAGFDKKLMIFGAGHYADSALVTGKTFISGNVIFSENADQSYIEGVEINGNITVTNNNSVNSFTIKRCRVIGNIIFDGDLSTPSTNLALIGNVLMGNVSIVNVTNAMISNNIFNAGLLNTNGNQISNNVFLSNVDIFDYYVFSGNNNTFSNNICIYTYNNGFAQSGSTGNFYYNNLFVAPSPTFGITPTYIGNYTNVAQANIFVNQTGSTFNYSHDYHLKSPETYLGTDATQVGIYGGAFPYKEGAVPLNPHIQIKNISPSTDVNGDLQIQIQVKAQND